MYDELRLLVTNLITSYDKFTLSSQATGLTSGAVKDGTGVAKISVTGNFAAALDLLYESRIDSVAGGVENGEATFKWRTSDTAAGAWEETGVATRETPAYALSADGLGGNLSVAWTGNVGDDFAVDDFWRWWAKAKYGPQKLIDLDRHTFWKTTGDTSENAVIDHGSATQVTAAILADHNLTSGATVKYQRNATDSWGSPSVDYTFSTITDPLIYYLDQTYRYSRWLLEDPSNPDTYIQVGHIGEYVYDSLEADNANWGSSEMFGLQLQENESEPGVLNQHYYADKRKWNLTFGQLLSNNDVDTLVSIQEALIDTDTDRILPVWVHLFYAETSYCKLMNWRNIGQFQRQFRSYLLNSGVTLNFEEAVKTI